MKKSLVNDLNDAIDCMESIKAQLPKMSLIEKVDTAARLRTIAKACGAIDVAIKAEIKDHLKHKEGEVLGQFFKALLKLIPVARLNQSLLKAEKPKLCEEYTETSDEERITFESR